MAVQRHEIPILEYDDAQHAVIMPNRTEGYSFPEKAVFAFLGEEIPEYARKNHCSEIGMFETITKIFPVWKTVWHGEEICFCQAPLGGAAAAQFLDFLIACGVRYVISAGSCGVLVPMEENEFLIPVEAVRDEGASYHYLPPARTIRLERQGILAVRKALERRHIPCRECKTWTTDGFFRETKAMVEYRREEGCQTVEMECASLAACAQFRDVLFGQFLYTADTLADLENYDTRDWGEKAQLISLEVCFDAVCELGRQ